MFALAVLAVLMTAVAVYYYYSIVKAMFLTEAGATAPIEPTRAQWSVAVATFAMTIGIGVLPQFFITRSVNAAKRFPVNPQSRTASPSDQPTAPQTGRLR
jgi:NADH:ubiquinone oxidoreductase subunit 2 (subunit N)